MRSHTLAAAAAVLLLSVSPSHAVTWTSANKWLDLVVPQSRFNCVTVLPIRNGYAFHRLALIPGGKDSDLYVYGYNGSWVYISASAKGGLVPDTVIFNASTRSTYNSILACVWGFGGASQFDLYYAVGN